jgi:conjugative transfer signal peptidase TraF
MVAASSTTATTSSHGPNGVVRAPRWTGTTRHRLHVTAKLGLGLLLLACPKASTPTLLWNASPSVPLGPYWLAARPPTRGALAVIRLPEPHRSLADSGGYLPAGILLIKPVVARPGDVVCRHGPVVTLHGRAMAHAKSADPAARPLPRWSGCIRLSADQVFVLSADPDGFDSRYIGPVERRHVVGTALPLWHAATK